jgi:hypothetical protein
MDLLHGVHPLPLKKSIIIKKPTSTFDKQTYKGPKKNKHEPKNANRRARIHTLLVKDDGLCMCDGQLKGNGEGNLQKHKT